MGIPGFHSWFMSAYGGAYVPLGSVQADHVYVDMNSILHTALRGSTTWVRFHKKLHSRLNNILDVLEPTCSVVLAVDGPAPLAKLLTQRARRNKGSTKAGAKSSVISSNAITPGTMFMADLTVSLSDWITTKLSSRRWQHLQMELSDATVVGEGECKILGRMARPWQEIAEDGTHVIVGDDADLVLMACLAQREHVYVASTAKQESELSKSMKIFSVDKLHQLWSKQLLHHSYKLSDMSEQMIMLGLKMDLTLIAVMCKGDDYLTGLYGMPTLPRAWQAYCQIRRKQNAVAESICFIDPATGHPNISLPNLINFIQASGAHIRRLPQSRLARNGTSATAAAGTHTQFNDSGTDDDDNDQLGHETDGNGDTGDNELERNNAGQQEEHDDDASNADDLADGTREEVLSVSQLVAEDRARPGNYVRGLLWILQSYIGGECPDYRYSYGIDSPAAASILAWAMEQSKSTPIISYSSFGDIPEVARQPLLPIGCALALLPHTSSDLLPHPARELMVPTSPLGDLYEVCEDCDRLKDTARTVLVERAAALTNLERLRELVARAEAQGVEVDADIAKQLAAAKSRFETAREANRQAASELAGHLRHAHPYKPFPIDSVAAASTRLSSQDVSVAEQWLFRFGQPVVLGTQSRMQAFQHAMPFPKPPTPFEGTHGTRYMHTVASVSIIEDSGQVLIAPDTYLGPDIDKVDYLCRSDSAPNLLPGPKQGSASLPTKRRGSISDVNQERKREPLLQPLRPVPKGRGGGSFNDVAQASNVGPVRRNKTWELTGHEWASGTTQHSTHDQSFQQQPVGTSGNPRPHRYRQREFGSQANASQAQGMDGWRQQQRQQRQQRYDSQPQYQQPMRKQQPSSQGQQEEGKTTATSRPAGRSPRRRAGGRGGDEELIPGASDVQQDYVLQEGGGAAPPPPPRNRGPQPPTALPAGLPPPPLPSAAMLRYAAGSTTYHAGLSTISYTQTSAAVSSGQTRTRSPTTIQQTYPSNNAPRRPQHIRWP